MSIAVCFTGYNETSKKLKTHTEAWTVKLVKRHPARGDAHLTPGRWKTFGWSIQLDSITTRK